GADVHLRCRVGQLVAVGKAPQARVLEEPPDDRLDVDVVAHPGNAGPQAADAADDEVDFHSGCAGLVELLDDDRVDQRVHLRPYARRLARLGTGDLRIDQPDELRAQLRR